MEGLVVLILEADLTQTQRLAAVAPEHMIKPLHGGEVWTASSKRDGTLHEFPSGAGWQ